VVVVADGVYAPIETLNKAIVIQSVNGVGAAILDGGGTNRCATLGWIILHTNTVLTGFTLRNGKATYGGGAYYGTLNDCVLMGNTATQGGGGAFGSILNGCTLAWNDAIGSNGRGGGALLGTLNDCTLSWNTAVNGGGAWSCTLNGCTLSWNWADCEGGGAWGSALDDCALIGNGAANGGGAFGGTLNRCTVMGNMADDGGGAHGSVLSNCEVTGNMAWFHGGGTHGGTLYNCTLSENMAFDNGGGVYDGTLKNCIVWGNIRYNGATGNYGGTCSFAHSCTTPMPSGGVGNTNANPMFVNATLGDFRLQPESPCINTGNNAYAVGDLDLDSNPRIQGGTVDMGAYEWMIVVVKDPMVDYEAWLAENGLPDTPENKGKWLVDPNNLDAKFVALIEMDGDTPNVAWLPDLGDDLRTYVVMTTTNLLDGKWEDVAPGDVPALPPVPARFFRVRVGERGME